MRTFLITWCFILPGFLFSQLINAELVKKEALVEDSLRQADKRRIQKERFISDSLYKVKDRLALAASLQDTLYTWTRAEQVTQLRKHKVLLTKSRSEKKGMSLFDEFLHDSSIQNDPRIRLLCEERFAKKRFAWTDSWATIMGWQGEKYGDQLIQVVLRDSAIIGVLSVNGNQASPAYKLIFVDYRGNELEEEDVIRNAHRIAAVIHTNIRKIDKEVRWRRTRAGTFRRKRYGWIRTVRTTAQFKEYVIVNESMIRSWSYGTPSVREKLDSEIEFLELVRDSTVLNKAVGPGRRNGAPYLYNELRGEYFTKTCFGNKYYRLKKKRIAAILGRLRKARKRQGEALSS